jgi:hypothetical protein
MRSPGIRSISRALTAVESTAPPETTKRRRERSYVRASIWSSSGRANGSPTICRAITHSRSQVASTSAGSNRVAWSGSTTVPPETNAERAFQWAAPCMKGAAGNVRSDPPRRAAVATMSALVPVTPRQVARKSPWRHSTPFGMPVVPPV